VRYEFRSTFIDDQSPELIFSTAFMPKEGTQFLLFLVQADPKDRIYETYRGPEGRIEISDAVLAATDRVKQHGGFSASLPQPTTLSP
jgi:hypothetical protein